MKKSIRDINLEDKKVLIRAGIDVPLNENLEITDDSRIVSCLDTINYALEKAEKVIIMGHLGRPKGEVNSKFSFKPVAKRLSKLLNKEVILCSNYNDDYSEIENSPKGSLILLENLRFNPEEEKNDEGFAKRLAGLADVYVNEAFSNSHRNHASMNAICRILPSYIGIQLEKELKYLGEKLNSPEKPFFLILGGSKVSDKIQVIDKLIKKVDKILIGGAMAYTFMKAKGISIGNSRFEGDKLELANELIKKAKENNVELILPVDYVVGKEFKECGEAEVNVGKINDGVEGFGIGPATAKKFAEILDEARTVLWNGPLDVFEIDSFSKGSLAVCKALADNKELVSIVGGGDTAACVNKFGLTDKITHVSTGGGASLEFLEGKELPGLEFICEKE
jgi:3-phosphoglycerate kinase